MYGYLIKRVDIYAKFSMKPKSDIGPQLMRIQPIRNNFLLMRARSVTFSMIACNGREWWTYTNAAFLS